MLIRIEADEETAERELLVLLDWLRNEPDIRKHAQISLYQPPPEPGRMGVSLEAVNLILSSGFSLANLAVAIAALRRSGGNTAPLVIEDGNITITIAGGENDAENIARVLGEGRRDTS